MSLVNLRVKCDEGRGRGHVNRPARRGWSSRSERITLVPTATTERLLRYIPFSALQHRFNRLLISPSPASLLSSDAYCVSGVPRTAIRHDTLSLGQLDLRFTVEGGGERSSSPHGGIDKVHIPASHIILQPEEERLARTLSVEDIEMAVRVALTAELRRIPSLHGLESVAVRVDRKSQRLALRKPKRLSSSVQVMRQQGGTRPVLVVRG